MFFFVERAFRVSAPPIPSVQSSTFANIFLATYVSKLFRDWKRRSLATSQNSGILPLLMSHTARFLFHNSDTIEPTAPLCGFLFSLNHQFWNEATTIFFSGSCKQRANCSALWGGGYFAFAKLAVSGCPARIKGVEYWCKNRSDFVPESNFQSKVLSFCFVSCWQVTADSSMNKCILDITINLAVCLHDGW